MLELGLTFLSTHKKAPIHTYVKHPKKTASAVVLFFHGLGLHATAHRYVPFIETLTTHENLVYFAWDCPHHGRSSSLVPKIKHAIN